MQSIRPTPVVALLWLDNGQTWRAVRSGRALQPPVEFLLANGKKPFGGLRFDRESPGTAMVQPKPRLSVGQELDVAGRSGTLLQPHLGSRIPIIFEDGATSFAVIGEMRSGGSVTLAWSDVGRGSRHAPIFVTDSAGRLALGAPAAIIFRAAPMSSRFPSDHRFHFGGRSLRIVEAIGQAASHQFRETAGPATPAAKQLE
jgi:hypothetical protein